ncbi:unnamed protein product [Prorocentrum cordatum]|uniref:EF-hand domain-containing protein n=1 Tax=Prorocentrum cordatum TaxID=2364126 RepID=A0ABN9RT72_9DINO|nr:unnamed protein product [Polarella glacialis]
MPWGRASSGDGAATPAATPAIAAGEHKPAAPSEAKASVAMSLKAQMLPALTATTMVKSKALEVQILLGNYAENGSNHGRKTYKKIEPVPGHPNVKVFVYFWDGRDGADFSGWWFGDQVGGSQVWARCASQASTPPRVGWMVPWDSGKAEPGLLLLDPAKPSVTTPVLMMGAPQTVEEAQARAVANRMKVEDMEALVKAVTDEAKGMDGVEDAAALKEVQKKVVEAEGNVRELQQGTAHEIGEVRKGGPLCQSVITEMSKVLPRIQVMTQSLKTLNHKLKAKIPREKTAEELKKEETDKELFSTAEPEVNKAVEEAGSALNGIARLADAIEAETADAAVDALTEIESASQEAQGKITEARMTINTHLRTARSFVADVQKIALKEFTAKQQELTEHQKALNVFKEYRKHFNAQVAARKAFVAVEKELEGLEAEVQKASELKAISDEGEKSVEAVKDAEKLVGPVLQKLTAHMNGAVARFNVVPVLRERLSICKERSLKAQASLQEYFKVLRPKIEVVSAAETLKNAHIKVGKVEEAAAKCDELEMPFLKGVEVETGEAATKLFADCDAASMHAQAALGQATAFLRKAQADAKSYVNTEVAEKNGKELAELIETVEALQKKCMSFKTATAERKTAAVVSEVTELVSTCEEKMKIFAEAATLFSSDWTAIGRFGQEDLDNEPLESLKEALEKSVAAEKEASSVTTETRKTIQVKVVQGRVTDTGGELAKLNTRMTELQAQLQSVRKNVLTAEKLIKSKDALASLEVQVKEAEAEANKVEEMTNLEPGEELTDQNILDMEVASASASKLLKDLQKRVDTTLATVVPGMRPQFLELKEKCKGAEKVLDVAKESTKEQRERVLTEHYVKEAQRQASEVEAAMEKVSEAELPFLKGIEVLPLASSQECIKESEGAAEAAKALIAQVRTYVAGKNAEIGHFDKVMGDPAKEEMLEVTQRINTASQTLNQFWKDLAGRKMTARLQETEVKLGELEGDVKAAVEVAGPFIRGEAETMEVEEANTICLKYMEMEKVVQAKVGEMRVWLSTTLKDIRQSPEHMESLKKLQAQFTAYQADLAGAKKSTSVHEQCITAKRIHQEVAEMLGEMEAEVKKSTEATAPLLERGGEDFLVAANLRVVAGALLEYMGERGLSMAALLKEVGDVPADFAAFVGKLPEVLGKEELGTTEDRRAAMFRQLDKDEDGKLTLDEFEALFVVKYVCRKEVAVTDTFETEGASTLGKLNLGDIVQGVGQPHTDESGLVRVKCRLPEGDATGFVTVKGNAETVFLDPVTAFYEFFAEAEKTVEACGKAVTKSLQAVRAKGAEFPRGPEGGRLAELKGEFSKLMTQATATHTSLLGLKKRMAVAKVEYSKAETAERNAHILAKEQKEADLLLGPARERMKATEASTKALEDACAPLTLLQGDALQAFATPAAVLDEAERLAAAAQEAVASARATVKEQQAKLNLEPRKVNGPVVEAKKAIMAYLAQVESSDKAVAKLIAAVHEKCREITASLSQQCAASLRALGKPNDELFAELALPEEERIPEEAMRARLLALDGVSLKPEHAALICRQIGAGGIGKFAFLRFMQRFYVVMKSSVVTDEFDIESSKVLRKLDVDEVVELMDGPRKDEKVGLTRIQARCLRDNAEGWISVKGNQGTSFLEEVDKPYYVCSASMALDMDAKGKSEVPVRALLAGEAVELVEGPLKERLQPNTRARGKAVSDGATGWVTVVSSRGATFLEEGRFFTCVAAVPLTDELGANEAKVLKQLVPGEVIAATDQEPAEDDGALRMKARTLKDELEGWVTMKSQTGQPYVTASSKYYTVLEEVPVQKSLDAASAATARALVKGEVFQVLEGPKEESSVLSRRARVKAVADGAVGWITLGAQTPEWVPYYTCKRPTPMHTTASPEGAAEVRQLAVGEEIELLDGPKAEGDVLRLRGRAKSDGATGWVTIRSDGAGVDLEPSRPTKRGR